MMTADAIRAADTEHQIHALLKAYLETAPLCKPEYAELEPVVRLPINGFDDIKTRFKMLILALDDASKDLNHPLCALIRETLHILGTALNRIAFLSRSEKGVWNGAPQTHADGVAPHQASDARL